MFSRYLNAAFRVYGANAAIVDQESRAQLAFAELRTILDRFALLAAEDQRPRTVVSLLPNSVETLVAFLGCGWAGCNFISLSPNATAQEIDRLLALIKIDLALTPSFLPSALRAKLDAAGVRAVTASSDGAFAWLPGAPRAAPSLCTRESDLLIATSGSTGEPKMLRFPYANLWREAQAFAAQHRFMDSGVRLLNNFSMSYLGGLLNGCIVPLCVGGSTVVCQPATLDAGRRLWHEVRRSGANVLWLFPTVVRRLMDDAASLGPKLHADAIGNLRAVLVGMAPVGGELKEEFERLFRIPCLENYALSETGFLTTETLESRALRGKGSVGQILPGVAVRLRPVPDAPGAQEILVASPYGFAGYVGAHGDGSGDADGYFATGDLGEVDEFGQIVLKGRIRDIIKKPNQLIYLAEIEALAQRHPAAGRAAAVPVADAIEGETFDLHVELRDADATCAEFTAWLHSALPTSKWPRRIRPTKSLPLTSSGKVRKSALAGA